MVVALLMVAGCSSAGSSDNASGSGGAIAPTQLASTGGTTAQRPMSGVAGTAGAGGGSSNPWHRTMAPAQPAAAVQLCPERAGVLARDGGPDIADMDASVQQPGPGGFPKGDAINVEQKGPYTFMSYTEGLDEPDVRVGRHVLPRGRDAAVRGGGVLAGLHGYQGART